MENIDMNEVKKQLEYYFSDKNLSQDEFFHNEIEKSEEGYLTFEMLLNCNKLKKMNASSKEILIKAIGESEEIEFDEQKGIRRKNNKALPEFKLSDKVQKKIKKNDEQEKLAAKQAEIQPKFYSIDCVQKSEKSEIGWKEIMNEINKLFNVDCYYFRYSKVDNEGHFAIDLNKTEASIVEKIVDQKVKLLDKEFEIKVLNEEQIKSFHEKHGYHYNVCLNPAYKKQGKKQKKDQQKQAQQKKVLPQKEIVFANKKYEDVKQLKNIFKNIINKTENDGIIEEPQHSMLMEILKYHDNEQKVKDVKNFTVNIHPIHHESRCFFIIREDGSKEDFSLNKCVDNLAAKISE